MFDVIVYHVSYADLQFQLVEFIPKTDPNVTDTGLPGYLLPPYDPNYLILYIYYTLHHGAKYSLANK